MIQLSTDKIFFTSLEEHKWKLTDPRRIPLAFDLVSGHACSHCNTVVQAVYRTRVRMKERTKEHFQLEKPAGPASFAPARAHHEIDPKYHSYLLEGGDEMAEMIREDFHFSLTSSTVAGRCKYTRAIWTAKPFNLIHYLFATAKVVMSKDWLSGDVEQQRRLLRVLNGPDPAENEERAKKLFEALQSRMEIVQDVTGVGNPMWLLCKDNWGFNSIHNELRKLDQ